MKSLTFSCTNVWIVISCDPLRQLVQRGQLAVDQQVGDLEVAGVLAQLLDRVAAVLQDAGVAVDVGDRAAARGRVHEGRVVGHQPEVVVVDLDLAEVHGAHGAVGDRQLVGAPGAVVGDESAVLRPRRRRLPPRVSLAPLCPSTVDCSVLISHLLSAVAGAPTYDYAHRGRAWPDAGLAGAWLGRGRRRCERSRARAAARPARRPMGAPAWQARQPRARVVGMQRARARADAAVLPRCRLGRLTDRPADDQEQSHDRDLQEDHQPDEGPRGHSCGCYPR